MTGWLTLSGCLMEVFFTAEDAEHAEKTQRRGGISASPLRSRRLGGERGS